MNIYRQTIGELKKELLNNKMTVSSLVAQSFDRISKYDEKLNAMISLDNDRVEKSVEISQQKYDQKEPRELEGMPVVIKDMLNYDGTFTTAGSKMLANYQSIYTATVVEKLVDAGAIILGKANMDEFAMGSSGENSAYGPTRNPWDTKKVPGGSSSGSAVAVAAGYCMAALGSDTGGSIRQPACLTGVVGLKPTFGRVSRYGAIALGSSLDQVGPLARKVDDVARMFKVIAGYDPKDATTDKSEVGDINLSGGSTMKVGVVKELFEQTDKNMQDILLQTISMLKSLGYQVENVSWPDLEKSIPVYYIIQSSEASSNLARYDGIRYGLNVAEDTSVDMVARNRMIGFGSEVKRRIMLGTYSLSSGYYDDYFQKAARVRTLLIERVKKLFTKYDLLLGLTSPYCAFNIGEKINDPLTMYLADIMTVGVSLAGLPACNLPAGFIDRLPVGVQIIGKWFDEGKVLKMAYDLEKKLDLDLEPKDLGI